MKPRRILFYSHDTHGLGHIRRTQKIANTIAGPETSILIACASPMASSFASQPGIEYLNLPGFTKQVTGEYRPRNLNIPMDQFVNLRASLLLSAVRSFGPDVVVIDKEPLGVKKELLPALEYLREHRRECQVVCGFRDILDEKKAVLKEWHQRNTVDALERFFDHVLIYGDRDVFDFASAYDIPESLRSKMTYVGYVHPKVNIEPEQQSLSFPNDRPIVTFTLGGGGDGWECLETFVDAIERGLHDNLFNSVILSGPFASQKLIARARALGETRDDVFFSTFVSNTQSVFNRSRLIVSMGGYNTLVELAAMGHYPLILPRTVPREEQLIRARVFKDKGYCDYIHPSELTPESLMAKVKQMIHVLPPRIPQFSSGGLDAIQKLFREWLGL